MWANVLQIVIATYLLSRQIGVAFVGPIIVSAVSLVATVMCGPPSKRFMMAWITKVQERVGKRKTLCKAVFECFFPLLSYAQVLLPPC